MKHDPADAVTSEGMCGAERVRYVTDGRRPEGFELGCSLLDGSRVVFRSLGGADAHHEVDPRR